MSIYVMSDIHGCFDDFQRMLEYIDFSIGSDALILAGDYIDRGPQSYEMFDWIENNPLRRRVFLKGNHEEEYIANIDILTRLAAKYPTTSLSQLCVGLHNNYKWFDVYGTIRQFVCEYRVSLEKLQLWATMCKRMPLTFRKKIDAERYIFVHAGYKYGDRNFYLYARDNCFTKGGERGANIIAGHTPTILPNEQVFNNGNVYHYYNEDKNCHFYNIDCGCVFRNKYSNAKLACMRLDDKRIYYI